MRSRMLHASHKGDNSLMLYVCAIILEFYLELIKKSDCLEHYFSCLRNRSAPAVNC